MHVYVHAESIVEAALCKSVLKPLREPIYQSLEKLHANNDTMKQLAHNQVRQDICTLAVMIEIESKNSIIISTEVYSSHYRLILIIVDDDANGVCVVCYVCQSAVLGSTTTALGITTAVPEAPAMEKISIKLNNLHLEYSPQKKIELLLKSCKIIYDSMSVSCPGENTYYSVNL